MITITSDEANALANHLEWYIIQEVKDDEDYDNIQYLAALLHVYERCKMEQRKNDPIEWEKLKQELGVDNFCEVKP